MWPNESLRCTSDPALSNACTHCVLPLIAATWRGDLPDAGFIQLTIPPAIVRWSSPCSSLTVVDKQCSSPPMSFAAAARWMSHESSASCVVAASAAVHAHGAAAASGGSSCVSRETTIAGVGWCAGEVSRTTCESVPPTASRFTSMAGVGAARGAPVSSPRRGAPTRVRTCSVESSGLERR